IRASSSEHEQHVRYRRKNRLKTKKQRLLIKTYTMKIWKKNIDVDAFVEKFTVGNDRELDLLLAEADVLGSLAHTRMLNSINLLEKEDLQAVQQELKNIYQDIQKGNFQIEDGIEDIHSQIELMLTRKLGDAGKKIHSGRSRNDQVLVDLKIYFRNQIQGIAKNTKTLFNTLIKLSNEHKNVLM